MKRLGKCNSCGVKPNYGIIRVTCPNCGTIRDAKVDMNILGEVKKKDIKGYSGNV